MLFATGNGYPGFVPKNGVQYVAATKGLAVVTGVIDGASVPNVTLRGLNVVGAGSGTAADPYGGEALKAGTNWIAEDVDVIDAKGFGIRPYGDGCIFRRVRAIRCSLGGWWSDKKCQLLSCGALDCGLGASGWHAVGGVKFYTTDGVVVDGGEWARNKFPGIWFDWENKNFVCRNAYVHHNLANPQQWHGGIALECNQAGQVEANYISDNVGGGLVFWENPGTAVEGNTFVRNGLSWRNVSGRNHTSTGNVLRNNKVFGTTLAPFAGNTISGTVVLTAEPPKPGTTPPVVPPVTPPVTPTVPAGAIRYGPDNFGNIFHVGNGELYRNGIKIVGAPVREAFTLAGFFWQRTQYGFHQATADGWEPVTPTDPRPATPVDPKIAELEAKLAEVVIHADLLEEEIISKDATIALQGRRLAAVRAGLEVA